GTLVALADDLEQQVGAVLVDGQVTELIDNKDGGLEVAVKFAFELAGGLGGGEGIDDVDGGREEHRVSIQAGGVAQSDRQVCLAEADIADQHNIGVGCDEGEAEQVLDLRTVDLFGPAPLEVFEGLEHGEACVLDATRDAAVVALRGLAVDELGEI